MNPDEMKREIERRVEFLAYDKERIAALEAQCAAMRAALLRFDPGAEGCYCEGICVACDSRRDAALASDAGKVMLLRSRVLTEHAAQLEACIRHVLPEMEQSSDRDIGGLAPSLACLLPELEP